jgi:hypothetical protein
MGGVMVKPVISNQTAPPKDFKLWRTTIPQIQALGGHLHLGNYVRQGHKIWAWRYDLENRKLYHCNENLVNINEPSTFPGARTRANRYSRTRLDQSVPLRGGPCTVEEVGLGIYRIISFTNMPPQITHPETFLDVLCKWGCTWMWEEMCLTGDDGWLAMAI